LYDLTRPVTACRPNDSLHIHHEPQAGGNTVQWVGYMTPSYASFTLGWSGSILCNSVNISLMVS
jgi:hypothetical protein